MFLSVLPMVYEYLKHRREAKAVAAAAADTLGVVVEDVRDGSA